MDSLSGSGSAMRTVAKYVFAIAILGAVAVYGLSRIPASVSHSLATTYQSAPESDDALRAWLAEQPGVVEHTIQINRYEENRIELHLIVTQDSWRNPPFPDIDSKCTELGYNMSGPFTYLKPDK